MISCKGMSNIEQSPSLSNSRTKDDRQMLDTKHPRWRKPPSGGELYVLKALQQGSQYDLRFEPGEVCPRTNVGTDDKGQMRVGLPPDVEMVRVGKHAVVTVGRGKHGSDPLPLADELPTQFDIDGGSAWTTGGNGRIIAQHLFNGTCDQVRLGMQFVCHLGMLNQALHHIAQKGRDLQVRSGKHLT